jgi:hypothetical protein
MDTGATDHLTSELDKLAVPEPYHSHDKICTTNGAGIHISRIGQASLLTHTSKKIHLRNVLHVPSATHNLLYVPKLPRDNNVFVEFHTLDLFDKDRATRDVLLRGQCRNGLYALDVLIVSQVFSGVRVSSSQWHSRLGHPFYTHRSPCSSSS